MARKDARRRAFEFKGQTRIVSLVYISAGAARHNRLLPRWWSSAWSWTLCLRPH